MLSFPFSGQIPAQLFYRETPDTRDFATEHRSQYKAKENDLNIGGVGITYGPDGVPVGVDPQVWRDYVAKHGAPPP